MTQATDEILTPRLRLRALREADADALVRLAGDRAVADTMISVPHPFTDAHAADWIERYGADAPPGPHRYFAATSAADGALVGLVALRDIDEEHAQAELSFWIGRDHWGRGLAREAGAAVLAWGFDNLGLNRIVAFHMVRNAASGRVLAALGFANEGLLRERVRKWGSYEDVYCWALLRREWMAPGVPTPVRPPG